MKSIAALAFLAATVAAQSPEELRGQLPECALSCIEGAAKEVGCDSGDFECECKNQDEVTAIASQCQSDMDEAEKCNASDLSKALSVADEICEAVKAGGGDDEDSDDDSDDGDEPSATDADDSSATESATDADETDDASQTDSEDEPSSTDDSGDAEESGAGGEEGGDDAEGGGEEGAATKLGSYGWAGAAAAAVALIF